MKEKIRSIIVNKYKTYGYGKKAVDAVVDYIDENITEESEIDAAVDKFGPLLKTFQGEIDRLANAKKSKDQEEEKAEAERIAAEKVEAEKAEKEKKGSSAGGGSEAGKDGENTKALFESYMKPFMDQFKEVSDELKKMKSGEVTKTRKEIYDAKLEGLPDSVKAIYQNKFGRLSFKDDEDFDTFITGELEPEIATTKQSIKELALTTGGRPGGTPAGAGAASGGGSEAKATDAQLDAIYELL